jgi:hypothetical protein
MNDIERSLRAAMHAVVDGEQAAPGLLLRQVRQRHRRHTAVLAAAVVLAVLAAAVPAALAARYLTPGRPPASRHSTPRPKPPPSRMSGLPIPAGTSFQLLITTAHGAAWYSTATGRSTPITGLPDSNAGYQTARLHGGWLAWASRQTGFACSSSKCAGPPQKFYVIGDGSSTARLIGSGASLSDASTPGSLWLLKYPHPTDNAETAVASAQRVSWTGRPVGPAYLLPAGYSLWRGVGSYLLLAPVASGPDLLWNPRSGQVVRRFDDAIDAGPDQIIWSQGCPTCRLQVLNVTTGSNLDTVIPANPPGGLNETLTDDGSLLAVQLPSGQLAALNTSTGALTVIQGTAVSSADWQQFSWRDGGDELVVTAGPNGATGPMQIAYWHPRDGRLRVATIRAAGEISELETGSLGT